MVKIKEYIESGILEAYVLGAASEAEANELIALKAKHPQIQEALFDLEVGLEHIAQQMAVEPPAGTWSKIEYGINEIIRTPDFGALTVKRPPGKSGKERKGNQFIDVDASSSHMRVHKMWRWIMLGIFILGKIFLGLAIYFYLETRQIREQVKELKTEIKNLRHSH